MKRLKKNLADISSPEKERQLSPDIKKKKGSPSTARKNELTSQVKQIVAEMLLITPQPKENYSVFISNKLGLNYTYMANIFSETEGITIEHHIINKKIESAVQMLLYSNYSISEIAHILHYSSIGHFSNQFKKVKNISPSSFRKKQAK